MTLKEETVYAERLMQEIDDKKRIHLIAEHE